MLYVQYVLHMNTCMNMLYVQYVLYTLYMFYYVTVYVILSYNMS